MAESLINLINLDKLLPHLILAPIILPMFIAAIMLLLKESKIKIKVALNLFTIISCLLINIFLLKYIDSQDKVISYVASDWLAPFGIALVLDRLSAMMLVLTFSIALATCVFSLARWHKAGVHFHPLFQLQLMGLSGAFLTADLFNLFVFFEIMLAASYGLLLHGSGRLRVQASLHYIAINLVASSLFLIGASILYGLTGTLNMADLALEIVKLPQIDRGLLHTATGILATAFLIKAAIWPLNFWLVPAYSSATAPVGALFALMTKVGIYTILRLWTLMFSLDSASQLFGSSWLIVAGMITIIFGAIGMLASVRLTYLAGYSAIISSGILLACIGFHQNLLTAGFLYYLPSSTLAVAILFLLADLIDRWRNDGTNDIDDEEAPFLSAELLQESQVNLDDNQELLIGRAIPAAAAFLGLAFIMCTLLITGLPPLSGFMGKFAILTTLINPLGLGNSINLPTSSESWILVSLIVATGLLSLLALTRAGIRNFWSTHDRKSPKLTIAESLPIAYLMALCIVLTVKANDVMHYTLKTSDNLHNPNIYINSILNNQ